MPRAVGVIALLCVLGGCGSAGSTRRTTDEAAMFGPVSMRIHPIFTRVRDWTGDGNPDGVEALLEFQDQFGDPTKATGGVVFELFEYEPLTPDHLGRRVTNPWIGSLESLQEQQARWNRTSRTYTFQLAYPQINPRRGYVLTAIFEPPAGGRLFDRTILEAQRREETDERPTTQPVR